MDTRTLARLLYLDMVPSSYVPSRDVRDLRELLRHRKALVEKSTAFKNRVHAELLRRGIKRPDTVKGFTSDAVARMYYYGHIFKHGYWHLRWMMVESVHVHLWCCPKSKLSAFYSKPTRKKGKQVARIATARKMLPTFYRLLLKKEFKVIG